MRDGGQPLYTLEVQRVLIFRSLFYRNKFVIYLVGLASMPTVDEIVELTTKKLERKIPE